MKTESNLLWLPGQESRHFGWDSESGGGGSAAGVRITPDTALKSTAVLACARVLAETVAGLPLHLYKRTGQGRSIANEQPLYSVLHEQPNSWQTSFEWREQSMLHVCLWGNAYSEIRSGSAGSVTELHPLHPSRMSVERIENGKLRYKYREPNGTETVYRQDKILHVRWMSSDGVTGMIPVDLAKDAVALARACELHGASYFGNGAIPGVVLETDQTLEPSAASSLRENWERMHRGAGRAHRTAVLMGGLKAHELTGTNTEAQFLESRRFQVEEICRLFRVPPHLVGDLSRSSFSNIEQQSIDFVQHTLLPWLKRFETAFSRDLITDRKTHFAEFDTRGLLRGDAAARASYYSTLWNLGVLSINEIRGFENMNSVDGGDERFVQLSMTTIQGAKDQAETQPEEKPQEAPAEPEAEEPKLEQKAEDTENLAAQALNGAQISGLLTIIESMTGGLLDRSSAEALISAAFPMLSATTISAVLDGAKTGAVVGIPEEPVQEQNDDGQV
ncbi:MAG: phage portal protein [Pirellulales bacterium]